MSGMLLNGRTANHRLNYNGCACHNTKQARRRAKKSVKAKGKATVMREAREARTHQNEGD